MARGGCGAAYAIETRIAARQGLTSYPCACRRCRGGRMKTAALVAAHHRRYGRDPYLRYPVLTEDGRNIRGPSAHPEEGEEDYAWRRNNDDAPRFVWPRRTEVEIEDMVNDAFARGEELHAIVDPGNGDPQNLDNDPMEEYMASLNMEDMEELIQESTEPLYSSCAVNRLQASIVFINMVNLYGVPHTFLDELLCFIASDLLPQSNCLPRNTYEIKKLIMKMGLEHRSIHCCPEGHVLYEGEEHENLAECPVCRVPRYIHGSDSIPRKVLRYFPIIPRLQRLFRCPHVAQLMKWHVQNKCDDGYMRLVVDSPQWAAVDQIDPTFKDDDNNVFMGMVSDGVNPFGNQSTKYSMWPVLLMIYNLPPWLVTKKFFVSLTVLIPGDKSLTGEAFDVFISPLVQDLLRLWEGVPAVDTAVRGMNRRFTLRAILLWTINDFPVYGLNRGQQTKGYKGCPVCASETCADHSRVLSKMVYLGNRRWLPEGHRFRRARASFDGNAEQRTPPTRPSGNDIRRMAEERVFYLSNGGREDGDEDPVKLNGMKRLSVLFVLPYWEELPVRQLLDVMHCEKNVCDNILKTLLGEKDNPAVRIDLQRRGIRPQLWLQARGRNGDRLWLPDAPYVLSRTDKEEFFRTMRSIRTPSHYVSTLHNRISKGKMRGLKSHDYHILLQQILPVCLRNVGDRHVVGAIMRVSRVFQRLCAKAVQLDSKDKLMEEVAETLACLEREFPPAFFDVMVHLIVHLVEELFICGPVHTRWMYPYECFFKGLKGFVRNLARPEGSVTQGYQVEEALGFVTKYMTEYNPTSRHVWDSKEDPSMTDEIVEGKGRPRKLSQELRKWMHNFVLDNATQLQHYREEYEEKYGEITAERARFRNLNRRRRGRRSVPYPPELAEPKTFADWLEGTVTQRMESNLEEVEADVVCLSKLPSEFATKYRSMWAFGNHLRVVSAEEHLKTRDSGVAAIFRRPWRAGSRDNNVVLADVEYVGELHEIVELNYRGLCVVVLLCKWVKAIYEGHTATVKKDSWGFTLANFNWTVPFGPESFTFPMHVEQVFFVDAIEDPGWKVVLRKEIRGRRVHGNLGTCEDGGLFVVGNDGDHEGLRIPNVISEGNEAPLETGRTIRREDTLVDWVAEVPEPELDLGESGSSSEEED